MGFSRKRSPGKVFPEKVTHLITKWGFPGKGHAESFFGKVFRTEALNIVWSSLGVPRRGSWKGFPEGKDSTMILRMIPINSWLLWRVSYLPGVVSKHHINVSRHPWNASWPNNNPLCFALYGMRTFKATTPTTFDTQCLFVTTNTKTLESVQHVSRITSD